MLSEKMLPVSGAEFFGRIACRDRLFLFRTDLAVEDGKMGVGLRRWMKEGGCRVNGEMCFQSRIGLYG